MVSHQPVHNGAAPAFHNPECRLKRGQAAEGAVSGPPAILAIACLISPSDSRASSTRTIVRA